MNFPLLLSAAAIALGLSSPSAQAASLYQATQSLTFKLVQDDDDVGIAYQPTLPILDVFADGDIPTYAQASDQGTLNPVTLNRGLSFTLLPQVAGLAGDNTVANLSEARAERTGLLTLENTGTSATRVVFEIFFDLAWLATVDDPATETAMAEVFFEVILGQDVLLTRSHKADTLAGFANGTEVSSSPFQLEAFLAGGQTQEYVIRAISKGKATTLPTVVPLPAAGWLLIAGLGGLALVGRRKAA